MQQLPQHLKQLIAHLHMHWGQHGKPKQQVTIRLQGTQAHAQYIRQTLQQQQAKLMTSGEQSTAQRVAFLNKFHAEAQYSLDAQAQITINRMVEALKAYYFWNTNSLLTMSTQRAQADGNVSGRELSGVINYSRIFEINFN